MASASELTKNPIYAFVAIKMIKLLISYISVIIAANYTSQIYIDKVLVNKENPPQLTNMVYLYMLIEFVSYIIVVSLIYFILMNIPSMAGMLESLMGLILPDYIISCMISIFALTSIANVMYSKKYFLYKDDGLRAIRAFKDIIIQYSFLNNLIPYNFLFKGILEQVKLQT